MHGMQEVSGSIPLTSTIEVLRLVSDQQQASKVLTLSSRGLGHYPFTVSTGVRIPVGSPSFIAKAVSGTSRRQPVAKLALGSKEQTPPLPGVVVQLVRIPACHAGGRGFEPRPLRQNLKKPDLSGFLFCGFPNQACSAGLLLACSSVCIG